MEHHENIQLENRLTKLEANVEYVVKQVDNHIPTSILETKALIIEKHNDLQESVDALNTKLWAFIVTFTLSLLGLLLTIIFK